jgi:hypothetical protein
MSDLTPAPLKPIVGIAAVEALDIRVGTIERVEDVSHSDKLMKLIVEVQGAKRAINYPVYLGTQDMAEKFGVRDEYPSSFLISRDGRQVKRIVGPVYHPSLSKTIKGLL